VEGLRQTLRTRHHFTVAYTPWSNGTVEVVNREIMRVFRALLDEFQIQQVDWPDLVKLVQFVLNNSPSPRLNGLAPITAFTGLSSTSPLTSIIEFAEAKQTSMTEIRASQILCADALITSLDTMHKATSATAARYRALRWKSHDKRPNVNGPNISVCDFELLAKVSSKAGGKLPIRWLGPRRVTAVEPDWPFEVEDLISGEQAIKHSARLKLLPRQVAQCYGIFN
jgi:hypothetical protein